MATSNVTPLENYHESSSAGCTASPLLSTRHRAPLCNFLPQVMSRSFVDPCVFNHDAVMVCFYSLSSKIDQIMSARSDLRLHRAALRTYLRSLHLAHLLHSGATSGPCKQNVDVMQCKWQLLQYLGSSPRMASARLNTHHVPHKDQRRPSNGPDPPPHLRHTCRNHSPQQRIAHSPKRRTRPFLHLAPRQTRPAISVPVP